MKTAIILSALMVFSVLVFGEEKPVEKPKVEVLFVLDTTGSMGGLIDVAKAKIWYVAEQIIKGKPTPDVRMGLVAYRDKGDEYVTKIFDLTDNIDQIYSDLSDFKAEGGGDTPENVNLALYEAVHKIKWSDSPKTLKIIYLVGDSPPHNEYDDVQGYMKTAEEAIKKGIYINTVLCGNNQETKKIWNEISDATEGTFVAIEQKGGVKEIPTPYDDELAKLNKELVGTTIVYGTKNEKEMGESFKFSAGGLGGAKGASRAVYVTEAKKPVSLDKDLVLEADSDEKIEKALDSIKEDELPDEMKKMTVEERKKYIEEKKEEREKLMTQIKELSVKRDEYISEELKKSPSAKDGFDLKVIETLKKQAEKNGIKY